MNHLSYDTSVKLTKFLGKSIPVPMDKKYWAKSHYHKEPVLTKNINLTCHDYFPAFTLEDILSPVLCETIACRKLHPDEARRQEIYGAGVEAYINVQGKEISKKLWRTYYGDGGCLKHKILNGFPAVEAEINRLIKEK